MWTSLLTIAQEELLASGMSLQLPWAVLLDTVLLEGLGEGLLLALLCSFLTDGDAQCSCLAGQMTGDQRKALKPSWVSSAGVGAGQV